MKTTGTGFVMPPADHSPACVRTGVRPQPEPRNASNLKAIPAVADPRGCPVALFGRAAQTDVLAALIDGVHGGGGGGAVLVRGAPGIGKSALLASAEARASAAG